MPTPGAILERRPELSGIVFDILAAQRTDRSKTLTKFRIEDGSRITDHVITEPIVISFRAEIGNISLFDASGTAFRPQDAYDRLVELFDNNTLFDYQTGFELFENMILTTFPVVEELGKPGSLIVELVIEELRIVETELVAIPNEFLAAGKTVAQLGAPVNRGLQVPQPAEKPAELF